MDLANVLSYFSRRLETINNLFLESLLIFAVFIFLAKLIDYIVDKILKNELDFLSETNFDDKLIKALHLPIYLSVLILGFYFAINHYRIPKAYNFYLYGILKTSMILIWTYGVRKISKTILSLFMKLTGRLEYTKEEFIPLIDNILKVVIYITSLILLLHTWNINITPFLASAGIAGIVIGFGARESISDFIGGISIFLDRPYKVGDWLTLKTGEEGKVLDIGVRSTRIKTRDDTEISIPNSKMASKEITNISAPEEKLRISAEIGVAYGEEPEKVTKILKEIARDNELVTDNPKPKVMFREFANSSLNFSLLVWIEDPRKIPQAKDELNREIYKRLNKNGIEIPYPKRDVYLQDNS